MTAYTIDFSAIAQITDERFAQLCQANPDMNFERNAKGDLIIVAPTGGETGIYNAKLTTRFVVWNEQTQLGEVFDSSTCFKLPNGALRSPDVAWVQGDRWAALAPEQREKFPPIAPDFVLKLLSPSDSLEDIQAKMQEYRDQGVRLGWLLDRKTSRVEIYRSEQPVEILISPKILTGETVLPGFNLTLQGIWSSY